MYLLEKRSDNKIPVKIKLSSSKVILGSCYIKDLKNYKKVSKVHASLININGLWYIKDMESAHGVFLNFEKIGKDPVKVEYWTVIGLGGSSICDDVFTCVLCPYDKGVSKNAISNSIINHSESKKQAKTNFSQISGESGIEASVASICLVPTVFKPALLLEKRSDGKTPTNIKLSSTNVILGSGYVKFLKNYAKISKLHASLSYIKNSWYIKDFGSTHGVFLNFGKIGKDPVKVEYWDVIGLGGSCISNDVYTSVLSPYNKDLAENEISIVNHSKSKPSFKRSVSQISEKSSTEASAASVCLVPTKFKPALLREKRSDGKTPTNIKLLSPDVALGSGCIKVFENYTKISKRHAILTYINGSWYIKDLGSTHGVFLNLQKLGKDPVKVEYWDVIGLGGSFISDTVYTCVLCPYDKHLVENTINTSYVLSHSKDKTSSKTNLVPDVAEKNSADSSITNACFVKVEKCDSESFPTGNSECQMYPKESKRSKTSSYFNENPLNNSFDANKKVELYLRSNNITSGDNDNFHIEHESVNEYSQDDDAKSTTSSIESMNIIMYPSASVLSEIDKSKKDNARRSVNGKKSMNIIMYPSASVLSEIDKSKKDNARRSVNGKNGCITSSVHTHSPKSHFSESRKYKKKAVKRPVGMANVQLNSDKKLMKKNKDFSKIHSKLRSFFKT